jgi:hypothetical protein
LCYLGHARGSSDDVPPPCFCAHRCMVLLKSAFNSRLLLDVNVGATHCIPMPAVTRIQGPIGDLCRAAGGIKSISEELGCSRKSIERWAQGERPLRTSRLAVAFTMQRYGIDPKPWLDSLEGGRHGGA